MDPFLAGFADELVKTATPLITIPAGAGGNVLSELVTLLRER